MGQSGDSDLEDDKAGGAGSMQVSEGREAPRARAPAAGDRLASFSQPPPQQPASMSVDSELAAVQARMAQREQEKRFQRLPEPYYAAARQRSQSQSQSQERQSQERRPSLSDEELDPVPH